MKKAIMAILPLILWAFTIDSAQVSAAQAQDPTPFLGSWKGSLSVAGTELEIRIVFTLDGAKNIQGTFDSISQGVSGIKIDGIKVDGPKISFIINDPGTPGEPTFRGALDKAGKKIAGEFSQSGRTGTFSVDKEK